MVKIFLSPSCKWKNSDYNNYCIESSEKQNYLSPFWRGLKHCWLLLPTVARKGVD